MKLKIKKGATVEVVAGAEKGKRGSVLEVLPTKLKVRVQGVRVMTHFDKKEGILKKEGLLDYSNVKLIEAAASSNKSKGAKKKATVAS